MPTVTLTISCRAPPLNRNRPVASVSCCRSRPIKGTARPARFQGRDEKETRILWNFYKKEAPYLSSRQTPQVTLTHSQQEAQPTPAPPEP